MLLHNPELVKCEGSPPHVLAGYQGEGRPRQHGGDEEEELQCQ